MMMMMMMMMTVMVVVEDEVTYNDAVVPGAFDEIEQVRLGAEKVQMQHGRAQTSRHLVTFAIFNIILIAVIPAVPDNRQLSTWLFYVRAGGGGGL